MQLWLPAQHVQHGLIADNSFQWHHSQSCDHNTTNVTAVTELWSTSFKLVFHAHHICANSVNFLITWGLPITIFHYMCTFCVLYWPTLQFYVCVYISFGCQYVAPPGPGECWYNTLLCCEYLSSLSVALHAFSALCMYWKFRHHPHPLGYLCAKFCFFFRGLHCGASPWTK